MTRRVQVRTNVLQELLSHAVREAPLECCGLLAGRDGVIGVVIPATNARHSRTTYEIAPKELFELFRGVREQALDHLGIYHSHPHSENVPSASDLTQACYPETAYFIISPSIDATRPVRAFSINDEKYEEVEIVVVT